MKHIVEWKPSNLELETFIKKLLTVEGQWVRQTITTYLNIDLTSINHRKIQKRVLEFLKRRT